MLAFPFGFISSKRIPFKVDDIYSTSAKAFRFRVKAFKLLVFSVTPFKIDQNKK